MQLQFELKKVQFQQNNITQVSSNQVSNEVSNQVSNQVSTTRIEKTLQRFLKNHTKYEQGSLTTLENLREAYSNYMEKDMYIINNNILKNMNSNYEIKTIQICKACKIQLNGNVCCDAYNRKMRTNRKVVVNLMLI